MFLESITACGFLNIQNATKKRFRLQDSSANNKGSNITELDDSAFVKAFSIIFDKKYGIDSDLREFINENFGGKAFVKVVLWQDEENTLSDIKWLKNNRLTLVRNFDKPREILINNKSVDVNIFHEEASNLGFISLDGFHMHRLLDEEITKLSHFTGDDQWNLILGVNKCEDLVKIIEKKHLKRRLHCEQMEMHMQEMYEILPLKVKLRDDVRKHFQLTTRFNTLLSIASKQKLKILKKESRTISVEMTAIEAEYAAKQQAIIEEQAQRIDETVKVKSQKKLADLIEREVNFLKKEIDGISFDKAVTNNALSASTIDLQKELMSAQQVSLNKITKHEQSIEVFADFCSSRLFKTQAQFEETQWKLSFAEADEDVYEERCKLLSLEAHVVNHQVGKISKELDAINNEIEDAKKEAQTILTEGLTDYHQQLDIQMKILQLNSKIFKGQKQVFDLDGEIDVVTVLGQMEATPIQTLKVIEEFVLKDEELAADYLGPVFRYLKSVDDYDLKMWPRLKEFAYIILFCNGSGSRKANRMLVESGIKTGPYVFLGIDEFAPTAPYQIPPEIKQKVISADLLISDDCRFKKVLKLILCDVILVNEDELNRDELSSLPNVVVCGKTGTTIRSKGCILFASVDDQLGRSTSQIDVLQNIYGIIRERALIMRNVDKDAAFLSELKTMLQQHDQDYHTLAHTSLFGLNKLVILFEQKTDSIKQFMLKSKLNAVLQKLEAEISQKKQWNVQSLKKSKNNLRSLLADQEVASKKLEPKMSLRDFASSVERMEAQSDLLSQCSVNMINPDQQNEERIKTEAAYLATLQQQLDDYKQKLVVTRTKILEKSKPIELNQQLEVELVEIRMRIYEKASEGIVVDDAMSQCVETMELSNKDSTLYEQFHHESFEALSEEIAKCQRELQLLNRTSNLSHMTNKQYGHLVESIKKIRLYSESPIQVVKRRLITAKTYPIINKFIIKTLKDAVYNCQTTFSVVMSNFIKNSTLFFYTRELFNDIKGDDFSWNCFDLGRLKAMDFVVNWKKEGKEKVSSTTLQKVKGLLLIMHIISYLSIFKFIIIDEKIFDNMDEHLEQNIRKFLETVSPFVQIVLLKDQTVDGVELMDVS